MNEKPADNSEAEKTFGTQEDLGDDLIEGRTLVLEPEAASTPVSVSPAEIANHFQSAQILFREGMQEEAKKLLRRILLADSRHAPSRKLLEEIHESELKQMFSATNSVHQRKERRLVGSDDPDQVLEALDKDLGLGLARAASELPQLSLFREMGEEHSTSIREVRAQDRVDLGIAFMEMGFIEPAIQQFEFACQAAMLESSDSVESENALISCTGLLARARIEGGKSFEAILNIEPLLRDTEVQHEKKLELLYLMGRALEQLKQLKQAEAWFQQVIQLDPEYRDVRARVQSLREEIRS